MTIVTFTLSFRELYYISLYIILVQVSLKLYYILYRILVLTYNYIFKYAKK